jgi:hypothetical protein
LNEEVSAGQESGNESVAIAGAFAIVVERRFG